MRMWIIAAIAVAGVVAHAGLGPGAPETESSFGEPLRGSPGPATCATGARCSAGEVCAPLACASANGRPGCCETGSACTADGYCLPRFRYYFGGGRTCALAPYLCDDGNCHGAPPAGRTCARGIYVD